VTVPTDQETSQPDVWLGPGAPRRGLTAVVLAGLALVLVFLVLLALARIPAAHREPAYLSARRAGWAAVAVLSVFMVFSALAVAGPVVLLIRRPSRAWLVPLGVAAAALVAWILLKSHSPALRACPRPESLRRFLEGRAPRSAARLGADLAPGFLLTWAPTVAAMILGGAVTGAWLGLGRSSAARVALPAALACLPVLVLCWIAADTWNAAIAAGKVAAAAVGGGWAANLARLALGAILSANAAAIGYVCIRTRAWALGVVLIVTVALPAGGWFLVQTALGEPPEPPVTVRGRPAPQVRPAGRGQQTTAVARTKMSPALRWCLVQWSAVLTLALGYLIALHAIPWPRRRVQGARRARTRPPPGEPAPPGPTDVPPHPRRAPLAYALAALAYLVFVVYGSFVPLDYQHVPLRRAWRTFLAVRYLRLGVGSRSDLVANCLLFIPLMFLAMGAITKAGRRRWAAWVFSPILAAGGTALACSIEFAQVYFPSRTRSLNDIVAESIGGVIGIALWLIFGRRITRWAGEVYRHRVGPAASAAKILAGYVVVVVVYQLMPFDLTISPVEVYRKLKAGKITLVPFTDSMSLYIFTAKVALMVPVGYLLWVVGRPGGSPPAWRPAAWGLLTAGAIEGAQLFVYSRYASTTDVILGALGAALGGFLAAHISPRARRPWTQTPLWRRHAGWIKAAVLAAWMAMLAWLHWRPFNFRWPRGSLLDHAVGSLRVPFYYLYIKTEFLALAQAARGFASFAILGLLARSVTGDSGGGKALAVGIVWGAALIMEGGQLLLPHRVPDLTTTLIQGISGTIGVLVLPWLTNALFAPPAPPKRARA